MTDNKLREALEVVRDAHYTKEVDGELCEGFEVEADDGTGRPLICVVEDALAEPVRNYEVGTAMEQGERFSAYCRAHKHPESECLPCPLFGQTGGHCELAWAQLPYEAEEGGVE